MKNTEKIIASKTDAEGFLSGVIIRDSHTGKIMVRGNYTKTEAELINGAWKEGDPIPEGILGPLPDLSHILDDKKHTNFTCPSEYLKDITS